jgi:hypothetical protein
MTPRKRRKRTGQQLLGLAALALFGSTAHVTIPAMAEPIPDLANILVTAVFLDGRQ